MYISKYEKGYQLTTLTRKVQLLQKILRRMPKGNNVIIMKFVHVLLSCESSIAIITLKTVLPTTATTAKIANTYIYTKTIYGLM